MPIIEIVGYAGSVLVAVSLMMSNLLYLRWLNLIGAAVLTAYSVINGVVPVAAVNGFIIIVDAYYIWQLNIKKDFFSVLEVTACDDIFLSKFLSVYGTDIKKFFAGFNLSELKDPVCLFILRNLTPVGLFIYENQGQGSAIIHLDYVIGPYRDLNNAHFLFKNRYSDFIAAGVKEFVIVDPSPAHLNYITKIGFTQTPSNENVYIKPLVSSRDFSDSARRKSPFSAEKQSDADNGERRTCADRRTKDKNE